MAVHELVFTVLPSLLQQAGDLVESVPEEARPCFLSVVSAFLSLAAVIWSGSRDSGSSSADIVPLPACGFPTSVSYIV